MKFAYVAVLALALVACASAQSLEEQCVAGTLAEGYYPHDTYCHKFFTCAMQYWRESTCYNGVWNQAYQGCDYPENVDCGNLIVPAAGERRDVPKQLSIFA